MVNMQTVDVDKIVEIAKKYADEHGWCGVVDDALKEAGLIKVSHYNGTLTFSVNVTELEIAGDINKFFEDGEFWLNGYTGDGDEFDGLYDVKVTLASAELHEVDSTSVDNWYYTSDNGRVLHYRNGSQFACGEWVDRHNVTKTSPRGEGTRCKKCVAKVDS